MLVDFGWLGRYLRHLGYEVNYVRNFTDVDDKVSRWSLTYVFNKILLARVLDTKWW